jgi:hypothetical protein
MNALIILTHWIGRQATCFHKCESYDGIATFIGTSAGPLLLCKDKMAGIFRLECNSAMTSMISFTIETGFQDFAGW